MSEITKAYEPKEVEQNWYSKWLKAECFKASVDSEREAYAIMIPPPNVTGMLHMGHVLDNTIQDIFVRRARLEGKAVLWQPGTDHAGIATQTKVEKQLQEENSQSKYDLGRDKFLEKIWQFRERSGGVILNQLKRLGASCDWSRTSFTLSEDYSKAVLEAFVKFYQRGYIYRGKRMINWCPETHTALSDEEVNMKPQNSYLYKMRYELVEKCGAITHLEISTTRPETLMGDAAVAVHPEDERYMHLIGKSVRRPFPEAEIPIIGDSYVDREFGTGCLKVTPAHDKNDFDIGQRHGLDIIEVIDSKGKLNFLAGEDFDGMDRFEARKVVARKLEEMGLLIEREPYENTVGFSERGNVPIEPRLSEQWFLKYPKVEEAKRAVKNGTIKFHPDRWKKTYLNWLNDIQDWCISRQLWWGHRIPVWYKKGIQRSCIDFNNPEHVHVSVDGPEDSEKWEQEEDVLDTWASSYLWPMANLGWPEPTNVQQEELDFWYPTSTLVTGFDIIFFWVARMIMAGLELYGDDTQNLSDEEITKRVPFNNVFIHGLIRDDKGRKMSKSFGNSPDPLDLIEKYGADGLRFGICNIAPSGSDILFSQERIQIGRNFCNKLWNAARFRQMSGPVSDNSSFEAVICRIHTDLFDDYDHWIISRLGQVTSDLEKCFRDYEIAPLTHLIYSFFWGDFCDWYLEASKGKLRGDECFRNNCLAVQDLVIRQVLQLSNPVIPHITEELWHGLGYDEVIPYIQSTPITLASTIEERVPVDLDAVERATQLQVLITQARSLKAQYNLATKRDAAIFYGSDAIAATVIEENSSLILTLVGLGSLDAVGDRSVDGLPAAVTPLGSIYLDLSRSLDVESEKVRLRKEVEKLNKLISVNDVKLRNPKFVESAPEKVVEGARKKLSEITQKRDETQRILKSM